MCKIMFLVFILTYIILFESKSQQKLITASKVSGQVGPPKPNPSGVTILESVPLQQKIKVTKPGVPVSKITAPRPAPVALMTPGRSLIKEREKKPSGGFSQGFLGKEIPYNSVLLRDNPDKFQLKSYMPRQFIKLA